MISEQLFYQRQLLMCIVTLATGESKGSYQCRWAKTI